jgi:hypothetical protein
MRTWRNQFRLCLPVALWCFGFVPCVAAEEGELPALAPIRLAVDGRARLSVVISGKTTARIRVAATTLADYLGRMSGAAFVVKTGDGRSGIALGRPSDFGLRTPWDGKDHARREDYLLRSHATGLYVLGASDLAVEDAVWDLLYRLGHRQFFPGPVWEVIPRRANLSIEVDAREHPSYLSRDIGYGCGSWDERNRLYFEWCARNRLGVSLSDPPMLESGHAYLRIHAELKDEFDEHPEYLALVDGKRVKEGELKFCISNADLRKLVAKYAVDHFTRNPESVSVSLEPSDGLGWCECRECRAMGSVSDRVALLCNEAAAAVRAKHGRSKLISIYTYADHSPPPRVRVDPQIVANVATAMTVGGHSTEELIDGWRKQGARLGIREYFGVYPWDFDLPGKAHMADLGYLKKSIPEFHRQGARFLSAESSDSWGVTGLGYYLTARLLWNVAEAERMEALVEDFLDRAFGPARKPMAEFYRLIDASSAPRISSDLIGRMYRLLAEARRETKDPAITARIDELVLYTRYVELYREYAYYEGKERQRGFEDLLRYTYRIRNSGMVHSLGIWRTLPYIDSTVKLPVNGAYDAPEGKNPWKENKLVGPPEVQEILTAGIARHRPVEFSPVIFGADLVPAGHLKLPAVVPGNAGLSFRDRSIFYTWAAKSPAPLPLSVKAGLLYQNLGDAKLTLAHVGTTASVDQTTVAPDQKEHAVQFQPRDSGLYRVEIADRTAGTSLSWQAGTAWTIPAGAKEITDLHGRWNLYFYVPRGTKVVVGYADGVGELLDGDGKKMFTFGPRPDYFSVPVGSDQQGKLWKFTNSLGHRILLTVPPYLAHDGRELLVPAEVVKADAAK